MPGLTIGRCVPAAWREVCGAFYPRDIRDVIVFPTVRLAPPPPRVSIPLTRLVLCSDCDAAYEIGTGPCPQCGAEGFVLVASFLRGRDPNAAPLPWKSGRGPAS